MIHYQLICGKDHSFDGWFRDSAAFELQSASGLVACPECGDVSVNRALMSPSIARRRVVVDQSGQPDPVPSAAGPAVAAPNPAHAIMSAALPDQVRSMLQRMRAEVEKHCENVGDRFADEARAIHRGESKERGIYGQSTPEQAEALADEGIDVAQIPWVPRADG
jgi:hypothetical protein